MNAAKFMYRVSQEPLSGCWLWNGALRSSGYGAAFLAGKAVGAHRAAWTLFRGEIPEGMFVCHKCDVKSCANPEHLFLGTHDDNMRDCAAKRTTRRTIRVEIYLENREEIAQMDRCAKKLNLSRSRFVTLATLKELRRLQIEHKEGTVLL
jgi:hypothetical protein